MPAGTTLGELVTMLREETGRSTLAAHGVAEESALKRKLRRTQHVLWIEHDWPHLNVIELEDPIDVGQDEYALPESLAFERINEVAVYYNGDWRPVDYGIEIADLNAFDPGQNERSAPIQKWEMDASIGDRGYRVWPLPNESGMKLRFKGQRALSPLVANADTCDLDDELIVLTAATEILERQGSKDAQRVGQMAMRLLNRLKGGTVKSAVTHMAAGAQGATPLRPARILRGARPE